MLESDDIHLVLGKQYFRQPHIKSSISTLFNVIQSFLTRKNIMTSPKHSRSVACFHVLYPCLTRFIKGFLEGTHFLRPSTFSAVQITLSCLVMCFPLSCRMCDDPSDWREHLKGIIPRTGFLRQQAQRRNGAAWEMLGMGHWPT